MSNVIQLFKEQIAEMKSKGTIEKDTAAKDLAAMLDRYDWFYDCFNDNGCITVYVEYMNSEVYSLVPNTLYGHNIKLAFSGYLLCDEKYGVSKVPDFRKTYE